MASNPFGRTHGLNLRGGHHHQPTAQPAVTTQQTQGQAAQRYDRERRGGNLEEPNLLDSLSEEQRDEVNEAFTLFDLDKDGMIDYHETKVALKALGFDLSKSEILQILQTYGQQSAAGGAGRQGGGQHAAATFTGPNRILLSAAAFRQVAARKILDRDPKEEIMRAFDLFDADNKGIIDLEDLRRVARELGEGLQEEELEAMIAEFDIRGDGGIDRDAFLGICLG
ncbi:EF-hand [Piedraia hortae CBS 480.64]|uniref:Calmodulin n=1 Tax=Piedraia hortae CBS 480.64 TaxID=1314780 RepID=A0A6A7BXH4_9PEZI|nr:EF-hand [Piedraia hortae CBS 480.64]